MKENNVFFKGVIYLTLVALIIGIIMDVIFGAYYRAIIWVAFILILIILLRIKRIPLIIHFSLAMLLIVAILGEYFFYNSIPFFDKIVHFISPLIICNLIYHLFKKKIKNKKMLILFCIVSFITISVIWEIAEYGFDGLVSSNMQGVYFTKGEFFGVYERQYEPVQSEIDDTMTDLIFGFLGACIFGIYSVFKKNKK